MSKCDRASIDIDLLGVEAEPLNAINVLGRECFVDLDETGSKCAILSHSGITYLE